MKIQFGNYVMLEKGCKSLQYNILPTCTIYNIWYTFENNTTYEVHKIICEWLFWYVEFIIKEDK